MRAALAIVAQITVASATDERASRARLELTPHAIRRVITAAGFIGALSIFLSRYS
jgi:hypothetical protein